MLPTIKKVLFATDLSAPATHAFGFALSIARTYGAELTVLHVIPDLPHEYGLAAGISIVPDFDKTVWEKFRKSSQETAHTRLKEQIEQSHTELGAHPEVPVTLTVLNGMPVDVITDEGRAFDLVVMGTQGHGRIGGLLMGSVAQGVLAKSTTPVMVVRITD